MKPGASRLPVEIISTLLGRSASALQRMRGIEKLMKAQSSRIQRLVRANRRSMWGTVSGAVTTAETLRLFSRENNLSNRTQSGTETLTTKQRKLLLHVKLTTLAASGQGLRR